MMKIALLLVVLIMPLIFAEEHAPKYDPYPIKKHTSKPKPVHNEYYPPKPTHKQTHKPKKHYCPKPKKHPRKKCYVYGPKYYDEKYEVAYRPMKHPKREHSSNKYDTYGAYGHDYYMPPPQEEPYCKVTEKGYFMHDFPEHKKYGFTTGTTNKVYVEYGDGYRGYDSGVCTLADLDPYFKMGGRGQGQDPKCDNATRTYRNGWDHCKKEHQKCRQEYAGEKKMWGGKYDESQSNLNDCKEQISYYDTLGDSQTSTQSSNSASTLSIVLIVVGAVMLAMSLAVLVISRRHVRKGAADNAPNAVMVAQTDPLRVAP